MFRRLNPLLVRLSRWPRRLAAVACLVLAAASALTPADGVAPRTPARDPLAGRLHDGQVAVPVTWSAGASSDLVRPGVRVGLYGSPDEDVGPVLVADRLAVLEVRAGDATTGADPQLVVVADRATAGRIATISARPVLVVIDSSP